MSEHFNRLADKVVDAFRGFLSEEARTAVGEEGFGQLAMLVEAHITDEVLAHLEKAADGVQQLAEQIRGEAEHFTN